jgi:translation initiation factor eIF-2B subunit beta
MAEGFRCFRQVEGSLNTAKQTADLLRQVISNQRLPNVGQAAVLIDVVKTVGLRMIAANPIG